ncbi:hypothetical protein P9112_012617 [Eukaryota sp. TZLM1-RC]
MKSPTKVINIPAKAHNSITQSMTTPSINDILMTTFGDGRVTINALQLLKYVFVSPWLVILRFSLTWTLIFFYWLVQQLFYLTRLHPRSPLSPLRRRFLFVVFRPFCRLVLFINGYYYIRESGVKPPLSSEYILVTAPHVGWQDIFYCLSAFPPSFIAKCSVAKIPFVGKIAISLQCIFVNRDCKDARRLVAQQIKERVTSNQNKDSELPLVVFPEGGTSNGKVLLQFKKGAFAPLLPVQPVLLKYTHKYCPQSWSMLSTFWHVLRVMSQIYNKLEVQYLPPVPPLANESAEEFAARVQQIMADKLGVPAVQHSLASKKVFTDFQNGEIEREEMEFKIEQLIGRINR